MALNKNPDFENKKLKPSYLKISSSKINSHL